MLCSCKPESYNHITRVTIHPIRNSQNSLPKAWSRTSLVNSHEWPDVLMYTPIRNFKWHLIFATFEFSSFRGCIGKYLCFHQVRKHNQKHQRDPMRNICTTTVAPEFDIPWKTASQGQLLKTTSSYLRTQRLRISLTQNLEKKTSLQSFLVGGFKPSFKKYGSNWTSSPK